MVWSVHYLLRHKPVRFTRQLEQYGCNALVDKQFESGAGTLWSAWLIGASTGIVFLFGIFSRKPIRLAQLRNRTLKLRQGNHRVIDHRGPNSPGHRIDQRKKKGCISVYSAQSFPK